MIIIILDIIFTWARELFTIKHYYDAYFLLAGAFYTLTELKHIWASHLFEDGPLHGWAFNAWGKRYNYRLRLVTKKQYRQAPWHFNMPVKSGFIIPYKIDLKYWQLWLLGSPPKPLRQRLLQRLTLSIFSNGYHTFGWLMKAALAAPGALLMIKLIYGLDKWGPFLMPNPTLSGLLLLPPAFWVGRKVAYYLVTREYKGGA